MNSLKDNEMTAIRHDAEADKGECLRRMEAYYYAVKREDRKQKEK